MLLVNPSTGIATYLKITVVIVLAAVIFSCDNGNSRNDFTEDENGTLYKVYYQGNDSSKAITGEIVTVNLQYRIGDSVIFDSKSFETPMSFPMIKPTFKGDIYDALSLMGTGDSISFAVVADSFYLVTANLPTLPDFIETGSLMYYDIKLLDHISSQEYHNRRSLDEKVILQKYINDNELSVNPTQSGLYVIPLEKGRGRTPVYGDMCQIYIEVQELNGPILYTNFGIRPMDIDYGKSFDTEGFMEGLGLMHVGETAQFIVPSWIGVGSGGRDGVDGYKTLLYKVKLIAIRTIEEVNADRKRYKEEDNREKERLRKIEPETIKNYLEKNNIDIKPTASGLYFHELNSGNGILPDSGTSITMEYVHYDLDGNVLQSSYADKQPFTFVYGTKAVIKGWEEAIGMMSKGSKAWILVPSKLGYGDYQRRNEIKPYSPLVFEIEVTGMK